MQKRHVLVCEGSLCSRELPDVSGPGLEEAGRYSALSEKMLQIIFNKFFSHFNTQLDCFGPDRSVQRQFPENPLSEET